LERARHAEGLLIIIGLLALGALYLWQNQQPSVTVAIPAASITPGDLPPADWQIALETQVALAGTPLATPDLGVTVFVPPTLPPAQLVLIEPDEIQVTPWPTPTPRPTTPPLPDSGPTAFPSPTGVFVLDEEPIQGFQPPPEQVPLSAHANDHYWLMRPVDASGNSESLFYYPFGSDGPTNTYRIHHGIDMPNGIGAPIQAGGSGTVIFSGQGSELGKARELDVYPAYGNAVVIEHDFGYRGQKLYTLYAHMTATLVEEGQRVEAGDIIGLSGGTGDVSGPHVHLEVRLGECKYFSAYNPLLWVAPYLGHGVVAGSVIGPDGTLVEDASVTLSRRGRVAQTTTTYIRAKKPGQTRDWDVVPDPGWQENFVMGDVPEGDYEISVTIYGQRISQMITVKAGTTNFVALGYETPATPQPVGDESS
jgi:murein DD-endopeptidase MepM/ murein hydrolase activator NlpD